MKKDPELMSQAELNEYLDDMIDHGEEDTTMFAKAYEVWEKNQ